MYATPFLWHTSSKVRTPPPSLSPTPPPSSILPGVSSTKYRVCYLYTLIRRTNMEFIKGTHSTPIIVPTPPPSSILPGVSSTKYRVCYLYTLIRRTNMEFIKGTHSTPIIVPTPPPSSILPGVSSTKYRVCYLYTLIRRTNMEFINLSGNRGRFKALESISAMLLKTYKVAIPELATYFLVYFLILHREVVSRLHQFTVHWPSLCLTDLG